MKRFLTFFVAIALLGLVVGLLLRRGAGSATPTLTPKQAEPAARVAPETLDASEKESAARTAVPAAETGADPAANAITQDVTAATTLIVHVLSKVDGAPLAHVRVTARLASAKGWEVINVDEHRGDMKNAPITDEHGRAEIEVPSGETLTLEAQSEEENCGWTSSDVHALNAHERREMELRIPCGNDRHFFGRLLARETNLPVAGANVRLMRLHGGRFEADNVWTPEAKAVIELRSDAAGRFDLPFPLWAEPWLRIEADGYGPLLAYLQPAHESPDRTQDLFLSSAASLHASVLDPAGKPIADTSIHLKARGFDLVTGGEIEEPGTWANFLDQAWSMEFDARGSCVINGLPAHVPLALEIHQGKRVLRREADPLTLEPGQVLERTWTIGGGARIEGRVLDQNAAPVAKHEIWLLKKTGAGDGYVQVFERSRVIALATSDEAGRFVLEDVPLGAWWIAAAPSADQSAKPSATDVASKTQSIEIASASTQAVTLRVVRGLFVRGRVLDPEGKPVSAVFVTCTQNGSWVPGRTFSGDDGAFTAGPFASGACSLWADASSEFAASDHVTAEPGQSEVVLRLKAAGKISGRVVDASTGEPCAATVHIVAAHLGDDPTGREVEGETEAEGRFAFDGLLPDRYDLAFTTTDGRFASASGVVVTAGKETADLVAKVQRGAVLLVLNDAKVPGKSFKISSGSIPFMFERGIDVSTRESISVPAGRLTIEHWTYDEKLGRLHHSQTVDVTVGETREVVLRDDG